jgi:hypothetical protein
VFLVYLILLKIMINVSQGDGLPGYVILFYLDLLGFLTAVEEGFPGTISTTW